MTAMDAARRALKEVFGYDSFRPGQEEAVAAFLRGRDVLAVMRANRYVIKFRRSCCPASRWWSLR